MKATIDFDEALYRRLKIEAVRRNCSITDLIAEGVRRVLDARPAAAPGVDTAAGWQPSWLGMLRDYAHEAEGHDMRAIRQSIATARTFDRDLARLPGTRQL